MLRPARRPTSLSRDHPRRSAFLTESTPAVSVGVESGCPCLAAELLKSSLRDVCPVLGLCEHAARCSIAEVGQFFTRVLRAASATFMWRLSPHYRIMFHSKEIFRCM